MIKYQANSSFVTMFVILMTALFYKALILQGEIWRWSLLGLKGLRPFSEKYFIFNLNRGFNHFSTRSCHVYIHNYQLCSSRMFSSRLVSNVLPKKQRGSSTKSLDQKTGAERHSWWRGCWQLNHLRLKITTAQLFSSMQSKLSHSIPILSVLSKRDSLWKCALCLFAESVFFAP